MFRAAVIGTWVVATRWLPEMHDVDDVGRGKFRANPAGGFDVPVDETFVSVDCTAPRELPMMQNEFVIDSGKLFMINHGGD